jgi:hypothetical protein
MIPIMVLAMYWCVREGVAAGAESVFGIFFES